MGFSGLLLGEERLPHVVQFSSVLDRKKVGVLMAKIFKSDPRLSLVVISWF